MQARMLKTKSENLHERPLIAFGVERSASGTEDTDQLVQLVRHQVAEICRVHLVVARE